MPKSKPKTDKPTDILINFILDKSGSMGVIADVTVKGFNTYLHDQQAQDGKCLLSLTLFDTAYDVRFVARDIREVPDMSLVGGPNPYFPSGGTALYNAVGTCILGTEAWLRKHPEFKGKVVTVILTDGEENSSHLSAEPSWHILDQPSPEDDHDVNNLINAKQAQGWEFVFLGSGKSAWTEARRFSSIGAQSTYNFMGDAQSTAQTYAGFSRATTNTRRMKGSKFAANAAATMSHVRADQDEVDETNKP